MAEKLLSHGSIYLVWYVTPSSHQIDEVTFVGLKFALFCCNAICLRGLYCIWFENLKIYHLIFHFIIDMLLTRGVYLKVLKSYTCLLLIE